jgi:hypothetical protein
MNKSATRLMRDSSVNTNTASLRPLFRRLKVMENPSVSSFDLVSVRMAIAEFTSGWPQEFRESSTTQVVIPIEEMNSTGTVGAQAVIHRPEFFLLK